MGLPMAINLLKAGHEVSGYDLQQSALDKLTAAGGIALSKVQDAAINQDMFITMLQTGEQVSQVCLGNQGLYTAASNALHIDCSSIDVDACRELHRQAAEHHLVMVDAPVSGGVAGANAATLTFMVGGEEHAFGLVKPILSAMGKNIFHTGMAGSGQAAKICNNMILGISMIAISEAFVLAEQLGLSAKKLADVVSNSSGQCWAMSKYIPVPDVLPDVPANRNYQPGFTAAMMLKDLKLSQAAALKTHTNTRLGEKAASIYQHFNDEGFGDLDFSAIIKSVQQESK